MKAETLVITDQSNHAAGKQVQEDKLTHKICIPLKLAASSGPRELYTPIPYIVPAQLLAAYLADVKGLDPDRPRALKKVTRTL